MQNPQPIEPKTANCTVRTNREGIAVQVRAGMVVLTKNGRRILIREWLA